MTKRLFASAAVLLFAGVISERAAVEHRGAAARAAPPTQRLQESSRALAAMLKAAKRTYQSIPFGGDAGTAAYADMYFWSCRWLEAERLRIEGSEQDIPAFLAHWERMRALHGAIDALHRSGARGGEPERYHAARFFLAEAALWLLRAGGAVPRGEPAR